MAHPVAQFFSRWKTWLAITAAGLALVACGGSGGDATPPAADTPVQVVDSFGQVVAAGDPSGVGGGDSGADGTAGEGSPIPGAQVQIVDAAGKTVTATTDAQGYYRVKVTGMTPPFVAKVTKADGSALRSLSIAPLKTGGFVTLNLSGLTDKIASDVARAGGKSGAADLTPAVVAANSAAINTSIANLAAQLASVLQAAGINPSSFNPLNTPFRADHTGYDKVLDSTKVSTDSSGATTVTVVTPFTGTWDLSVLAHGKVEWTVPGIPGSAVPVSVAQAGTLAPKDALGYLLPSATAANGYTATFNGNTATVTGPNTNYTITFSRIAYSNYQVSCSCGAVGSTVSLDLNIDFTEGGLLNGQNYSTTTNNWVFTLSYQRVN